jgi:hypothetical protein
MIGFIFQYLPICLATIVHEYLLPENSMLRNVIISGYYPLIKMCNSPHLFTLICMYGDIEQVRQWKPSNNDIESAAIHAFLAKRYDIVVLLLDKISRNLFDKLKHFAILEKDEKMIAQLAFTNITILLEFCIVTLN